MLRIAAGSFPHLQKSGLALVDGRLVLERFVFTVCLYVLSIWTNWPGSTKEQRIFKGS